MNTRFALLAIFAGAFMLFSVCCTEAIAKSDLGFKGIGARLGFVDPAGGLNGTIAIGAAFEFGEFVRQLKWDGSVNFWSATRTKQYYGGKPYDWTVRDLIFRSGVNYHFLNGDWVPYAGGGLGLHFYTWDYSGMPYRSNSNDTRIGLYVDGGIEHKFDEKWKGQLQVQMDFADPNQTALLFNLIYRLK